MSCDHTVLYMLGDGMIVLSKIGDRLEERHQYIVDYNKMWPVPGARTKRPSDFLDRRRGLATLFNYCPDCGEKINWKAIKKMVKEAEK